MGSDALVFSCFVTARKNASNKNTNGDKLNLIFNSQWRYKIVKYYSDTQKNMNAFDQYKISQKKMENKNYQMKNEIIKSNTFCCH